MATVIWLGTFLALHVMVGLLLYISVVAIGQQLIKLLGMLVPRMDE